MFLSPTPIPVLADSGAADAKAISLQSDCRVHHSNGRVPESYARKSEIAGRLVRIRA